MLKEGFAPDESTLESLREHCKKNIAKYALPYDIEIRKTLPKTLVGKVAYTVLEQEEAEKIKKSDN
jgi:long-chain acyl-CoA synthetase